LQEEQLEYVNDAKFENVVEILRLQAATEEAGCLIMATEQRKLCQASKRSSPRTMSLASGCLR
jgi:hypothetical protein